ncbi:MAG: glycosyltransferase family 87 protein, partial [Planctomycetota bacterium]
FDLIVVVLLAGAVLALVRGQSVWAGVLIGLAAVAKVTPAAYLGIFLLRRDYKGLAAGLVVIGVSMAMAWIVLPGGVYEQWLSNLSRLSADVSANNMSLRGVLLSALVGGGEQAPAFALNAGLVTALTWGIIVLLVGVTVYWLVRHRERLSSSECLAGMVPLVLLCTPITWTHHGVQLLIPLVFLAALIGQRPRLSVLDLSWLSLTLVLLMVQPVQSYALELSPTLHHLLSPTLTYAMLLMWLFLMTRYVPLSSTVQHSRSGSRPRAAVHPGQNPLPQV